MKSGEVLALFALVPSIGYLIITMLPVSSKSSNNISGGNHTRRVGRGNRKTRK